MRYYPIFLDLQDRKCVVIGGGKAAEKPIERLVDCGARVWCFAEDLTETLQKMAAAELIQYFHREWNQDDVFDASLLVVATDDPRVRERAQAMAREYNLPAAVEGEPEQSSFLMPAVVERDDLVLAVTTGGVAPELERKIKMELGDQYGETYRRYLQLLREYGDRIREEFPKPEHQKALGYMLVDSEILDLLEQGKQSEARAKADLILGSITRDLG